MRICGSGLRSNNTTNLHSRDRSRPDRRWALSMCSKPKWPPKSGTTSPFTTPPRTAAGSIKPGISGQIVIASRLPGSSIAKLLAGSSA